MNYRLLRVSLRNIEDRNFEIEFGEGEPEEQDVGWIINDCFYEVKKAKNKIGGYMEVFSN